MKHEQFKQLVKDANEQFNIVRTEGVTEVHWIYAGFDLYEKTSRHPHRAAEPASSSKRFGGLMPSKSENVLDKYDAPKYHVIAEISEQREHVVQLQLDASQVPERMRRAVLPIIVEYVSTPLSERAESESVSEEPTVKSAEELRKAAREAKAKQQSTTPIESKGDDKK